MGCIEDALKDRKFGEKKREELTERYNILREEYILQGRDAAQAEGMAAAEVISRHDADAAMRKRMKLAHTMKTLQVEQRLEEYKGNPVNMAMSYLAVDDKAPWLDIETQKLRIRGQSHRMLADLLDKHGRKGTGIRNRGAGIDKVYREVFGEGTGDPDAAAFAKAWKETTDFLRRRFNSAGGALMELEDWRFPQHQSRWLLNRHQEDAWTRDHMGWVDWEKMRDPKGRRIPAEKREEVLRGVFKTLKTDGHIKPPKSVGGKASVGNQLDKHRFLVFKDADSYLAMQNKYMDGQPYDMMMAHLDLMASRIAMVETFGPNPADDEGGHQGPRPSPRGQVRRQGQRHDGRYGRE